MRADYFAQSPDSGARTLSEGVPAPQRISTPHFDARLDRRFVGDALGAVTAAQVRERTGIRAPDGYELVAFTLQAGTPTFGETDASSARIEIEVGRVSSTPSRPRSACSAPSVARMTVPGRCSCSPCAADPRSR
ncbi:hypothetical protein G7085_07605 [Tessaracoccus sp. HDW20]|uniref:hypothetical protein n=1 Tax=Tessaracoccus coleopterorum TaxID=2714950 RepID=UPI0018D31DC2|nr:hypothetical protein [Tessaracoccus coleopterorum]NHB84515.1 hypothetical protein [Tessaracoccus coleopterorum]